MFFFYLEYEIFALNKTIGDIVVAISIVKRQIPRNNNQLDGFDK